MKDHYLTLLRDRNSGIETFRSAALRLSSLIAAEISADIPLTHHAVETPLAPSSGALLRSPVTLIPILRSGLVLLPSFIEQIPNAKVGFLGIRRDEKTAIPSPYYENIPELSRNDLIFLLDPMIATGASALLALEKIQKSGGDLSKITLVCIIASKEGLHRIEKAFPQVKIYTTAVDEVLDSNKYIVPGLGDFGDRFFGS